MNKALIDFYANNAPTPDGYFIRDIWSWDDDKLEYVHNYIQWLFPLREKSGFNPDAPLLDDETISEFQKNPVIEGNLLKSFILMLDFYGMELDTTGKVVVHLSLNFDAKCGNWITPYNHNFLRITRILKSLTILGLRDYALAFFDCLKNIQAKHNDIIDSNTFSFWKNAVNL